MICNRKDCTGCYACYNICPKNAIEMKEDEIGYIYPVINKEKCVNCNLCKKVCPQLKDIEFKSPKTAYAMYNKDNKIRESSTSGGAATTFYQYILKNNGIVYGASNIENGEFKFVRIENEEDLYLVKGSKYVHSYIKDIYVKVKEDLNNKKLVLFIGTPCQISGLKSYLGKEFENLITVDIICHGVPSQKLLLEEIQANNVELTQVDRISFRGNDGFKLKAYDINNNIILNKDIRNCDYYNKFMKAEDYRENCYECKYARKERVSDITIGDFWGLDKNSNIYDDENKGISLIMPITDKGLKLIEGTKENMNLEERTVEEAVKGNTQLREPVIKTKKYYLFKKYYLKYGYKKAMKKTRTLKEKLKQNELIYKIYKKIKGRTINE